MLDKYVSVSNDGAAPGHKSGQVCSQEFAFPLNTSDISVNWNEIGTEIILNPLTGTGT